CAGVGGARGPARAKRVLLRPENLPAEEALAGGFVGEIVEPAHVDRRVAELTGRLAQHAPITMRVSKEAIRRLLHAGLPDGDDLVRASYGSDDFRIGVTAFVEKREPRWTGDGYPGVLPTLAPQAGEGRGGEGDRNHDRLAPSFLVDRPPRLSLARGGRRPFRA